MSTSEIEWTDKTWNPVRGCVKVSPGCKHCYAEAFAERFRGVAGHPYEQGFDPRLVPDKLDAPLSWRKPCKVFVNSMSDLFMVDVPDDYIAAVFGVMSAVPRHTFQVLTKRAERLPRWFEWVATRPHESPFSACVSAAMDTIEPDPPRRFDNEWWGNLDGDWPLPNVQFGVSVEDRKYGFPRIDHLRKVPAAVRFLSIEPLLEDLGAIDLAGIHWVIAGGESGRRARPMEEDWVRSVRDQCAAAGVPFFYKQRLDEKRRKVSLPLLDGVQHVAMPGVSHVG
ncbi:MAG: phage Gp37/Gp68 family protein [Deltaproteobacteria bacterium]|nr:phage Gp37/Gp68 family protein [Myxococcales bacterium]MDP3220562.1 phage Gp37/Gp68 family protein [Deltaproteobacteria bacterium]